MQIEEQQDSCMLAWNVYMHIMCVLALVGFSLREPHEALIHVW